jgi:hypothetical protein
LLIYQSFTATGETTPGSPRLFLHDFAGDIVKNGSESGEPDAPCWEADAVDKIEEREVKKMKY